MVWPILISVAVTPGVSAAAGIASVASAAAASQTLLAYIVSLPLLSNCTTDLARRAIARHSGEARRRDADDAGHPHRHEVHEGDQEDAVDRLRRRLGDLVGEVRHELREHRTEEGAGDRSDAADDDADEELDRQEEA